jgi:uncharacterized membrane protein YfcA
VTILVLAVLFGIVIGLLLGVIGGGGSILTVPILVYLLGQPAHEATATSLIIVGLTALVGIIPHWRAGRVNARMAVLVGAAGIPGAFLGTWLNAKVPGDVLLGLFGVLMVVIASLMLKQRPTPADHVSPRPLMIAGTGLGIGIMTGFFGVGGGFLIVPALVMLLGLSMPVAVGTSLLVIAINSAAGTVSHGIEAVENLSLALAFVVGGSLGSLSGARLSGKINETSLKRGFALFVATLGLVLIGVNGWQILT